MALTQINPKDKKYKPTPLENALKVFDLTSKVANIGSFLKDLSTSAPVGK